MLPIKFERILRLSSKNIVEMAESEMNKTEHNHKDEVGKLNKQVSFLRQSIQG